MITLEAIEQLEQSLEARYLNEKAALRTMKAIVERERGNTASSPVADQAPKQSYASSPIFRSGPPKGIPPIRTGLAEIVRAIYSDLSGEFTIRTIADAIKAKHPERASTENLNVSISAVLGRDSENGKLLLMEKGAAGNPSVYRRRRFPRDPHSSLDANAREQPNLPTVNGNEEGATA